MSWKCFIRREICKFLSMYILSFMNSTSRRSFRRNHFIRNSVLYLPKLQNQVTRWQWKERGTSHRNQLTHKIKHQFLHTWLTVRHVPREISRHSYFFIEEGGNITGYLISITYKVLSVHSGGLEVLLLLTFSIKSETMFNKQFC